MIFVLLSACFVDCKGSFNKPFALFGFASEAYFSGDDCVAERLVCCIIRRFDVRFSGKGKQHIQLLDCFACSCSDGIVRRSLILDA